jgi:undecaprenyl-diphosphatase
VVQGIAEVVPVSSSAQLTLLPWLLRWEPPHNRTAFAAALHAGSCVGLAAALREELRDLDADTARRLALTAAPAALLGAVAQDAVERRLGGPGPTAALLAGAGVLMWVADRRPEARSVGDREATAAGLAQALALVPGVSRSGATMTALRSLDVRRADALRFSLLMSLPITAGAAGLTFLRSRQLPPAVPTALAAAAAFVTARAVPGGSHRLVPGSALYRLGLSAAVAVRLRRGLG